MTKTSQKFSASHIVTIVVALIGAVASLGGAWISTDKEDSASKSASVAKKSANSVIGLTPLGTIIASTLNYSELCELIGDSQLFSNENIWAPADGRDVTGSNYEKKKIGNNVPDLRGVFIRGLNKFYSDNKGAGLINNNQLDVKGDRSVGNFQADATKIPNNNFVMKTTSDGKHKHNITKNVFSTSNNIKAWVANAKYYAFSYGDYSTDSSGTHNHNVQIISGGDRETRPKNVSVYYYVKIN